MNELYILLQKDADFYGDEPNEWEIVGWTDDPGVSGRWRLSASMTVHRKSEIVKEWKEDAPK